MYSEGDDVKPKPIPVTEFAKYFKDKSANGAMVLVEESKARHLLNDSFLRGFRLANADCSILVDEFS